MMKAGSLRLWPSVLHASRSTLDFAVTGNTYISTLEEKYSGAAEDDPVKLLPTFMFPSDDDPDAMARPSGS